MPRRERELSVRTPFPSRSLVASATSYDAKTARIYNTARGDWQVEAYRHYRICGEARFAANFFGHALSRVQLYVTDDVNDPRAERLSSGPAFDALENLFASGEGRAAMLSAIGMHFTIAGECFLIGRHENGVEIWEIRSVLEVKSNGLPMGKGGKWWIVQGGNQPQIDLTENDVVMRLWTPDPASAIDADSPFRSLLPILEEIEWLTRYVFAQCSSRLAGAGLLLVNEDIDFPPPPDATDASRSGSADGLMTTLADAMLKPLGDPGNPAAKVPIVASVPGNPNEAAKWLTFWSELDVEAKALRSEAIQRFALGMDLPKERVLGMSGGGTGGGKSNGISHWGAWQVDEDTIKMHVEPMLDVVVNALTLQYLRPISEDDQAAISYDTSSLRLRPDRSEESVMLYNLGLIKGEVVVSENGFGKADMMDDAERSMWLLTKLAVGSATPDMVAAALRQLGVALPPGVGDQGLNQARPNPAIPEAPRALPNPEDSEAAALLAAADALVYRALERAGNRLRQAGNKPAGVASYETHTRMPGITKAHAREVLSDAWACADKVLDGIAEPPKVISSLDAYATMLLVSAQPHSRAALKKWLA